MSKPNIFGLLKGENFTDKVTFNESYVSGTTKLIKKGNTIFITYQGETTTHSTGDVLFTLPERI